MKPRTWHRSPRRCAPDIPRCARSPSPANRSSSYRCRRDPHSRSRAAVRRGKPTGAAAGRNVTAASRRAACPPDRRSQVRIWSLPAPRGDFMSDRFAGQKALFINCSIKHDKSQSHTQKLLDKAAGVMTAEGVDVEKLYALEHTIAVGMIKDGAEEGLADDWPAIQAKILAADIFVLGTPI